MSTPNETAHTDSYGATPLDPDEADGLLPTHITTQGARNAWEQLNIARAEQWVFGARRRGVSTVLATNFAREIHARMFDATWRWAGQFRRTEKNIGLSPAHIVTQLHECLENGNSWHNERVYEPDELAARLHHRLVVIHPWPNGNGRWARLLADAYLHADRQPLLTWGRDDLVSASKTRVRYLAALRAADRGEFASLLAFVRS